MKRQSWGSTAPYHHASGTSTPVNRPVTPTQQIQQASPSVGIRPNSSSSSGSSDAVGVGILFVQEEEASGFVRVTVKALIRGGSAEKSGLVQPGDMVVKVDGKDVIGQSLSILRNLIPGPVGTYCHLGFLRGVDASADNEGLLNDPSLSNSSGAGFFYDVKLVRSNPDPQEFSPPPSQPNSNVFGNNSSSARSGGASTPSMYNSQEKIMRANGRTSQEKASSKRSSFEKQVIPAPNVYPQSYIPPPNQPPAPRRSSNGPVTPMANSPGVPNYGRSSSSGASPVSYSGSAPQHSRSASPARVDGGYGNNSVIGNSNNNNHRSFDMAPHVQIARENELLRKQLKISEESRYAAEEELKRVTARRHELETVLLATQDRVASLETALRETKEQATQERAQLEHLLHKSEQMRREEEKKRQLAEHRCRQLETTTSLGANFRGATPEASGGSGYNSNNFSNENHEHKVLSNNDNNNSNSNSNNSIQLNGSSFSNGDGSLRSSTNNYNSSSSNYNSGSSNPGTGSGLFGDGALRWSSVTSSFVPVNNNSSSSSSRNLAPANSIFGPSEPSTFNSGPRRV